MILVDGRVAGNIVSWNDAGRRMVGYCIGPDYWGQGVATRALAAFLEIEEVFLELQYECMRISALIRKSVRRVPTPRGRPSASLARAWVASWPRTIARSASRCPGPSRATL